MGRVLIEMSPIKTVNIERTIPKTGRCKNLVNIKFLLLD